MFDLAGEIHHAHQIYDICNKHVVLDGRPIRRSFRLNCCIVWLFSRLIQVGLREVLRQVPGRVGWLDGWMVDATRIGLSKCQEVLQTATCWKRSERPDFQY